MSAFVVLAGLVLIVAASYFGGVDSRLIRDRGWFGDPRR
jgi:hypothetical protein